MSDRTEPQPGDPTPEKREAAREAWPGDREQIVHYTRRMRQNLGYVDQLLARDPDTYRSGSPSRLAQLEVNDIIEHAHKLLARLEDRDPTR